MCEIQRPAFLSLLERRPQVPVGTLVDVATRLSGLSDAMPLASAPLSGDAAGADAAGSAGSTGSSRRRRLWELPRNAFCPVLGSCLPMDQLRRLTDKLLGTTVLADDHDLHCSAVAECAQRGVVSERLQRELEERYALQVQRGRSVRSTEALATHWDEAKAAGAEVGAALWVTLTHPRCDEALQERVLRDIHMLQHQIGAGVRVDVGRMHALAKENGVLSRELAAVQERVTRLMAEKTAQIERQQSELMRLRAEVIARDSRVAHLREDLRDLEERVPTLRSRVELGRRLEAQQARIHDLERRLLQTEQRAVHWEERWHALQAQHEGQGQGQGLASAQACADDAVAAEALPDVQVSAELLRDKSILCVGGRAASVPVYRRLIETSGARFLHHDGGEEEGVGPLEASLAAADLVICQAGCISHGAYWRVKDHCKRTGKRCVFVDRPSASGLNRGLDALLAGDGWRPIQGPRPLTRG